MDHPPFPEDAGIGAGLAQLMITDSKSTNVQKAKIVPIFALEHPGHLGQRMLQSDNTRAITSRSRTSWDESLLSQIPA